MSEEEWDKEKSNVGEIDKNEKDINIILSFLSKENSSNNRGNALLRLEKIAPELTLKKIKLCINALIKIQDIETNPKIGDKINNLIKDFTYQSSRRSLHKLDTPKNAARNIRINSRNEFPKFGYVLGILGLLLGIVGGYYLVQEIDYEVGCMDLEFLEENYGEATQETIKECSDDYKRISSIATFLTYVSPILILFGILSTIYEYVKRR